MSRQTGSANFAGTIEVQAGGPLDARTVVGTVADLTTSGTFPYAYEGMKVYVKENKKTYALKGDDPTVSANWSEDGGTSITVDSAISGSSENPVQNKVIKIALDSKADLESGKVPAAQLPSFVDDVIDGYYVSNGYYPSESVTAFNSVSTNDISWAVSGVYGYSQIFIAVKQNNTVYVGYPSSAEHDILKLTGAITDAKIKNADSTYMTGVSYGTCSVGGSITSISSTVSDSFDLGSCTEIYLVGEWDVSDFSGTATPLNAPEHGTFYEESTHTTAITPETGKIYIDIPTAIQYRWTGTNNIYAKLGGALTLGETSSTAYRGDRGKTAYDISQTVGDVDNLQTTEKGSIVGAINEVRDFDNLTDRPTKEVTTIDDTNFPLPETPIKLLTVANKIDKANIYSTTEQIIGQWTDGKPLYQKTINFGTCPSTANTNKAVAHGVSNMAKLILAHGFIYSGDISASASNWGMEIPGTGSITGELTDRTSLASTYTIDTAGFIIWVDKTNINMSTGKDRSSMTAYVTLQYTKTSDSAMPVGTDTDYSTTEKIVGSWIDGKPLYQRTIQTTTPSSATSKTVLTDSTIRIKEIKGYSQFGGSAAKMVHLPYSDNNWEVNLYFENNNLVLNITKGGNDIYGQTAYVTIQYTKTTD